MLRINKPLGLWSVCTTVALGFIGMWLIISGMPWMCFVAAGLGVFGVLVERCLISYRRRHLARTILARLEKASETRFPQIREEINSRRWSQAILRLEGLSPYHKGLREYRALKGLLLYEEGLHGTPYQRDKIKLFFEAMSVSDSVENISKALREGTIKEHEEIYGLRGSLIEYLVSAVKSREIPLDGAHELLETLIGLSHIKFSRNEWGTWMWKNRITLASEHLPAFLANKMIPRDEHGLIYNWLTRYIKEGGKNPLGWAFKEVSRHFYELKRLRRLKPRPGREFELYMERAKVMFVLNLRSWDMDTGVYDVYTPYHPVNDYYRILRSIVQRRRALRGALQIAKFYGDLWMPVVSLITGLIDGTDYESRCVEELHWRWPRERLQRFFKNELLWMQGNYWMCEKQYQRAIRCYEEVLQTEPELPQVLYNLGHAYCNIDRKRVGIELLERASRYRGCASSAKVSIAHVYEDMGELDKAGRTLEEALQADPSSNWISFELSRIYCVAQRYEEAIHLLRRIQHKRLNDPHFYVLLGFAYIQKNDIQAGLEQLEEAARLCIEIGYDKSDSHRKKLFHLCEVFLYRAYKELGYEQKAEEKQRHLERDLPDDIETLECIQAAMEESCEFKFAQFIQEKILEKMLQTPSRYEQDYQEKDEDDEEELL